MSTRFTHPAGILPEQLLLICCARAIMDGEHAEAIRELAREGPDWDYLLEEALRQGMMPLLYRHIDGVCRDRVPEDALNRLQTAFRENAMSNLFLTGELLKIVGLFGSRHVPVISFKGPSLALSAYGSLSLRQAGDLDILVREQDVSMARRLLVSEGYEPQFDLSDAQETAYIKLSCEHAFTRRDVRLMVDLHWQIIPRRYSFAPDMEGYWRRSVRIGINQESVPALSAEDLFLMLCVHGAKHSWNRLSMVCDLSELIRAYKEMDWPSLVELARRSNSERMLHLGLYLAHDLLGARLPETLSESISGGRDLRPLAADAYAVLFPEKGARASAARRHILYLKMMSRAGDRARYFRDFMRPTPLEWRVVPLPGRLFFLYYLVRPVRLLGKYAGQLFRRFAPRAASQGR